jgi:hypothetical protein
MGESCETAESVEVHRSPKRSSDVFQRCSNRGHPGQTRPFPTGCHLSPRLLDQQLNRHRRTGTPHPTAVMRRTMVVRRMRRSRKPLSVVRRIEGSNPQFIRLCGRPEGAVLSPPKSTKVRWFRCSLANNWRIGGRAGTAAEAPTLASSCQSSSAASRARVFARLR